MKRIAALLLLAAQGLVQIEPRAGIHVRRCRNLTPGQQAELRGIYMRTVFPLVTPQAMDPAHPFPFISNLSLNLLVTVRYPQDDQVALARVKVPVGAGIPRLLTLASGTVFVPLEDVMAENLDLLVPGMVVESVECFRVTRNADLDLEEEDAEDLLEAVEVEVRRRRFGKPVRLEVPVAMSEEMVDLLQRELELEDDEQVHRHDGPLDLSGLWSVYALDRPDLKFATLAERAARGPAAQTQP